MNAYTAAVLSCRLLALFVLYQGLCSLSWLPLALEARLQADRFPLIGGYRAPDVGHLIMPSLLLPSLIPAVFSLFLWIRAERLAARMVPAAPTPQSAPSAIGLQPILLTVAGVLVLALAIPEAARSVATALLSPRIVYQAPDQVAHAAAEHWALLLRFLLGLGLTFGAAPLSRALDRVRSD